MSKLNYQHIFIPSYHRPQNIKTAYYFLENGYPADKIHVVIDNATDDIAEYESESKRLGFRLHIFDFEKATKRYDYVHRKSVSRRSPGMARNEFYDIARKEGIELYIVIDDDTEGFELRPFVKYNRLAKIKEVIKVFNDIAELCEKHHIGLFGLSQTGEMFGAEYDTKLLRNKVMNVTFTNTRYIDKGERGVLDTDTSQFVNIYNEGYFTASLRSGIVLKQCPSATQAGGLTELYNECKLLAKSLVTVIQFPSAIVAEKQVMNGGRLHHRINGRYLIPKVMKGMRNNIRWDAYPEDAVFTNEPKRERETKQ